jgi:transcriptional regulator with XRE-family HTH domain
MTYTFSATIRSKMEAKKLSPKEVAAKVNWSSEHIRKLCNSEAFPSKPLQKALSDVLEIDLPELEKQINADRWRAKYGKVPALAAQPHPILSVWDELTGDQQGTLLCVARCLARRRKKRAA